MKRTLIIDGEYLLKRSALSGAKKLIHKGKSFGGIYQFIITLKLQINTYNPSKVIVFWDNNDEMYIKKKLYPYYKENRKERDPDEEHFINLQRIKIKQYLEELFIRQYDEISIEADDLIAYYCLNSPEEYKIIYTADRDICQLIDDKTSVHLGDKDLLVTTNNYKKHFDNNLIENLKVIKIFVGCSSDNIAGVVGMGEKTFNKLFPEIKEKVVSPNEIKEKANQLLYETENKLNSVVRNLINGKTKNGTFGDEFIKLNEKIIDLKNPILTENSKENVIDMVDGIINPKNRNYKNAIKMMMDDGIYGMLPKSNDNFYKFFEPFILIGLREIKKYKKYYELN